MARNSVEYRRQPAKLLGLKALLRPKENEKDLSAVISQPQVALPAPARILISRAASISNLSSNSRECHPQVQPLPVKVSINQAASIINASSSRECRHRVKKVALLELREVLMAKAVANTKPKA